MVLGHGLVKLANSTGVELSINTYGLQLLNGLTDSLGGGILTEVENLRGSLPSFSIRLNVLGSLPLPESWMQQQHVGRGGWVSWWYSLKGM